MTKSKGKGKAANPPSSRRSTQGGSRVQVKSPTPDDTRKLWCLIDGDFKPFDVTLLATRNVSDLKRLIWEEGIKAKTDILAKDLTLWKVLHTETSVRSILTHFDSSTHPKQY
jgi:hypothetical protein